MLSYKARTGQACDIEAIREYQITKWGYSSAEACVIELSGLASPNLGTERDRTRFLASRVERIKREILRVQEVSSGSVPEFVVMYGAKNLREWEQIAGGEFDGNGLRMINGTLAVVTPAPTAHGIGNNYWERLGLEMAKKRDAQK
jgi:hypothetical protein